MKNNILRLQSMVICSMVLSMLMVISCHANSGEEEGFVHHSGIRTTESPIYPIPEEMRMDDGFFQPDNETVILLPPKASREDRFLARSLVQELADTHGILLTIKESSKLPEDTSYILMGSCHNPLVRKYCQKGNRTVTADNPGPEGYLLEIGKRRIVISGSDARGAFYGLQSLRQLIKRESDVKIPCLVVRDRPSMPFRGIKLYIPGRDNIPYFKRFIKDFMALYKYNKVILEVNAVMRLDRHPELNTGWREFAEYLNRTRLNYPLGTEKQFLNSTHHDAGDGDILEKEEVADLVRFANQYFIEVIPELPTLDHSFYLLTKHRELADNPDDMWPSAYCPSNPKTYDLLFDVFDEYIEVMHPKMIHVGRDEWWSAPIDRCPLCRGKDYFELFEKDINKIHQYLSAKKIKMAMWGDHLLENVRGKGYVETTSPTGYKYKTPGGLPLSVLEEKIPKDILIFNWFYSDEKNDSLLSRMGFKQIYGNFLPSIKNWEARKKREGVIGGAPSSWAATTEQNFGKDLMGYYIGCANLLWSETWLTPREYFETVERVIPGIRRDLDGRKLPSEGNDSVVPLPLAPYFNALPKSADFNTLAQGAVRRGNMVFNVEASSGMNRGITVKTKDHASEADQSREIQVNEDVSSIIFLHACAVKSKNEKSYQMIYNFDDSSDLLGWYEVSYEDGLTESIPVRYGKNILEWDVKKKENYEDWSGNDYYQSTSQDRYCYYADAIDCSSDMQAHPITLYAYEWENPRPGKKIAGIKLFGSSGFKNARSDKPIQENAIVLMGVSVVKKREHPFSLDSQ